MTGYKVPYTPGWDNHGMPIESAIIKEQRLNRKAMSVSRVPLRLPRAMPKSTSASSARASSVSACWATGINPYLTMDPKFEAEEVKVFGEDVRRRATSTRVSSPCTGARSDETALAEAEIEYQPTIPASHGVRQVPDAWTISASSPTYDHRQALFPHLDNDDLDACRATSASACNPRVRATCS